ncbi:hypothetical protein BHECKSOX_1464 [Bathymodiolus heckerae thiotrophic gill symbiont]|uniref:DUF3579 domain-containing protein n=1 Tax=Bathymodiolus heckerae thiotrophic gill symbiont TaxID=1052212 RepID=UPI0010B3F022|nr:DUF3579 domain-containing protein [Bathymodiolus heckerae thiotrophic gill symbiont]SHN91226.1 hypothetical protein BHECKSOX_1464 [Bathymodiolus heckerae thiotrophic gill symbiont]
MPATRYTISGVTQDGQKFRPSDWTERLVCIKKEQLIKYNGHLKVRRIDGIKSIVFDSQLQEACSFTFERLLSFAKISHLVVTEEQINSQDSN